MIQFNEKQLFPFRPKPFFFITTSDADELTYEKALESLTKLKERGFGGIVFFNKPTTGFDKDGYLSEAWFAAVKNFAKACQTLGLAMWINDGYDFPPGGVAGKVFEKDQTLHQQYLVKKDGKPSPVKADWGYPAFELPRSERLFSELVYAQYEKQVGEYFGNVIKGFFSDADNRRVLSGTMFDPCKEEYDYFPWSANFAETFWTKYEYDITPYLADIMDRKDISQAVDYWEHAGHLYQIWNAGNYRWLREHGLEYTGHSGDTSPILPMEEPRCSCFTEGRFSDMQSLSDYPGTDQELYAIDGGKHMRASVYYCPKVVYGQTANMEKMSAVNDISEDTRAKQVGSTAYLYGKRGAMCEMFAASNFGVEPETLRRIAAFQIMQGVTFVVPHAYHYRFCGDTKYFAPPDLSPKGILDNSVRELNDFIARSCALMSEGETLAPVALLDPTEALWRNSYDSHAYLHAFNALNHQAAGFVICDTKKILNGTVKFKAAVLAGFELTQAEKEGLDGRGVKVLSYEELDQIPAITGCDVCYEGDGTPIFTQRFIDGEAVTLISSVETDKPISGIISGYGRCKPITLYPGEIYFYSASCDDIPEASACGTLIARLPTKAEVTFAEENILPLEVFSNGTKTVTKMSGADFLKANFDTAGALDGIRLFVPTECLTDSSMIFFDDTTLCGKKTRVFDDSYTVYALGKVEAGRHSVKLCGLGKVEQHDRIFLKGDFDVELQTNGYPYKQILSVYNIAVYIPYAVQIKLSARRSWLLTDDSWALQGQPFYSGITTYQIHLELPEDGKYRLVLPEVRDVVWFSIDGSDEQKRVAAPYVFYFDASKGSHTVALKVANSYANAMEYYLERSGILAGGHVELLK